MKLKHIFVATIGVSLSLSALAPTAHADITISAQEAGGNVILNFTGSLNKTALSLASSSTHNWPAYGSVYGGGANIEFAPTSSSSFDHFHSVIQSGPSSIGPGGYRYPSSTTGDLFQVDGSSGLISLPTAYVGNTPISGSMTFNGTTLSGMGIDIFGGPYVWLLDTGERVTLTFGSLAGEKAKEKKTLKKKIKKVKSQLKSAKRNRQVARIKKLKKTLKALKKEEKAAKREAAAGAT